MLNVAKLSLVSLVWILVLPTLMALIFWYAPEEATQGVVQKIFYLHLGFVAGMYLPYFFGMLFAVLYLVTDRTKFDSLSVACVETGFVFTTGVLLSGSIWARPVWGAWWTWDPRLTTTLLIWLIFFAYFVLRAQINEGRQGYRWCSVLAIVGFLDVPLIHYSVRFFRGVHPQVITSGGIAPKMTSVLIASIVTFVGLAGLLIGAGYLIEEMRKKTFKTGLGEVP